MYGVAAGSRIVGIQLPIQTHTTSTADEWERSASPADLARVARVCDAAGYDYVGVCDHVALPPGLAERMSTHWVDPIGTLGWLAGLTERVMLLSHVYVMPYRHPRLAAKQFATLDWISGGRAICGLGAGHVQAEFEALGVDFEARGRATSAGAQEVARLLESEWVDGLGAQPRPVQSPRPPIWIGGSSHAAVRRAARHGEGWMPQGPATPELVELLVRTRAEAGRDDAIVVGHIPLPIHVAGGTWDMGPNVIAGTPSAVAEQLLATSPAEVNQFQVRFRSRDLAELCDQLEAFATEAFPILRTI